jgi:glycosyltransferase involved in cell wall biosynthesis
VRICIIGKFPPIQGGVAVRTYWIAHDLGARGHEVHVVTNAKEAVPPFRIHMRRRDWRRCEANYPAKGSGSGGSVTLHCTDPLDRSQHHIPLASPFVSKLAGTAAKLHTQRPFDLIYSHYLEPYGIAGHLAAGLAHVPHVVRMAGSDAGRLWRHPQLEALYDHVLRSAATVIASGAVAGRAIKHGVDPGRIAGGDRLVLPEDLFCPQGSKLDISALRREVELESPELRDAFWGDFSGEFPFFGIYGKLGETKGSFALLAAMARLKAEGVKVGLLAMAHGWPALEQKFRARAMELGIADRLLQIPFLPHWRVPEFLRSCLAVCCLEQDFPIVFHTPVIAREVLTCGQCLVASTEVIRKLPDHVRLPDGYGCVAIQDVQDIGSLSERLGAIVQDPEPIASVAARGRAFAGALQVNAKASGTLDELLRNVARRRSRRKRSSAPPAGVKNLRFPVAQAVARTNRSDREAEPASIDLARAREVLKLAERLIERGDERMRPVAAAIRIEIALAEAELPAPADAVPAAGERETEGDDPLFRLRGRRWGLVDGELATLCPVSHPSLRIITFDATELAEQQTKGRRLKPSPRNIVAFAQANAERREQLLISDISVRILKLSDGTVTAQEIAARLGAEDPCANVPELLRLIEDMFVAGLLRLHEARDNRDGRNEGVPVDHFEPRAASRSVDIREIVSSDVLPTCETVREGCGRQNR